MEQIQGLYPATQAKLEVGPAIPFGADREGIEDMLPQELTQSSRDAQLPNAGEAGAEVDLSVE